MPEAENQNEVEEVVDPDTEGLDEAGEFVDDHPIHIEWDALEFMHHERGAMWYLIGGIIAALMVVYAVITQAWTMAIVIAMLAGVVYLYSHETPKVQRISISRLGIHVGRNNYHYSNIESFWVIFESDVQTLNLKLAGKMGNVEVIQLSEQDPIALREVLSQYILEEEGKEENFVDKVGRWMKI